MNSLLVEREQFGSLACLPCALLLQGKDAVTGTAQSAKESAQSEAERVSMGQRWKEEMLEGDISA
jgi:hypothetical protein